MWSPFRDFGLLVRLALRLKPRVVAFHACYELGRWLLGGRGSGGQPTALYLETSSFCRGRCHGCYVPARDRATHLRLDDAALEDAITTARRLRPDWICLVGGEPLDDSILGVNLALVRDAPDLRFLICTGSHGRCDAALMNQLAELPNLTVMFSVDGEPKTHDRVRGAGSHARTLAALRTLASCRGLVGASVTVRPDNWREVTSASFVASLAEAGCNVLAYDCSFSPGADGTITSQDLTTAILRLRAAAPPGPVIFVSPFGRLRGDGFEPRSGMVAAAIDYRGNVYASRRGAPLGNVKTQRLGAILASDSFLLGCRKLRLGGCAEDDPRASLFEATLAS